MKKILFSLFVTLAASGSCLAQSITVAMAAAGGMPACTTTASSITESFSRTASAVNGLAVVGQQSIGPITVVKGKDLCSIPLLTDMFKGAAIPTITITITALVGTTAQQVLVLTLNSAYVTSLSDTASPSNAGGVPSESVSLFYDSVTIKDPINNTTATCSALSLSCS